MIFSVYLHKNVAEILQCYGTLSEVTNRILSLAEQGTLDVIDLPRCQSREGASRYDIDVTSEYYLELARTFPSNSARISLRRLLYYFVEQEMYEQLEWVAVNEYRDRDVERLIKKLSIVKSEMQRVNTLLPTEWKGYGDVILEHINNLEEILKNG